MQTVAANQGGDFVRAIIVMTIVQANQQHMGRDPARIDGFDGGLPDDRLRPISALAIANSLGVPRETVRRHIHRLVEAGVCRRVTGGYIIPETVLNGAEQQAQLAETFQHLRTFVSALRRAEVLEV
jgi:biotin operon repressor